MSDVHPLRDRFAVAAVTGTDGKTTTTTLIDHLLRADGRAVMRITTLGAFVGDEHVAEPRTRRGFGQSLAIAAQRGIDTLALETTSHALADGLARRFPPDVAVLTSFSRDHLDHHGSPEHYLASKAQLFLHTRLGGTVALPSGETGDLLTELLEDRRDLSVLRFGAEARDLFAEEIVLDEDGLHLTLGGRARPAALGRVHLPMRSTVHASNLCGALLAVDALGMSLEAMRRAIARFPGVPGRMQRVWRAPLVLVDFAHTPNALRGTLTSARALASARGAALHLVFGCGGERDRGKRPEMGTIASEGADRVIVTSDNPRREDPGAIVDAIEEGRRGAARWERELDRRSAIDRAIGRAAPDDVVVIAGRGHEERQELGDGAVLFSDVEVAQTACARHHPNGA